jgi:hypothetical protein
MAIIGKAADRMLALVVPKLTAGACCLSYGHRSTQRCFNGCKDCHEWEQNCVVNCFCEIICGSCYTFGPACC